MNPRAGKNGTWQLPPGFSAPCPSLAYLPTIYITHMLEFNTRGQAERRIKPSVQSRHRSWRRRRLRLPHPTAGSPFFPSSPHLPGSPGWCPLAPEAHQRSSGVLLLCRLASLAPFGGRQGCSLCHPCVRLPPAAQAPRLPRSAIQRSSGVLLSCRRPQCLRSRSSFSSPYCRTGQEWQLVGDGWEGRRGVGGGISQQHCDLLFISPYCFRGIVGGAGREREGWVGGVEGGWVGWVKSMLAVAVIVQLSTLSWGRQEMSGGWRQQHSSKPASLGPASWRRRRCGALQGSRAPRQGSCSDRAGGSFLTNPSTQGSTPTSFLTIWVGAGSGTGSSFR